MLRLSAHKAFREVTWSLLIVGVLGAGLTVWIVVPSLSASLEAGLADYASRVGTYIIISPKGEGPPGLADQALPSSVIAEMGAIQGVENLYPMMTAWTKFIYHNVTLTFVTENGKYENVTSPEFNVGWRSAVLGEKGFPFNLLDLVQGRRPGAGEAGFVSNTNVLRNIKTGKPYVPNDTALVQIAGVRFNATLLGINAFNPLLQEVSIFWDSTFLEQELGFERYEATFGGDRANLVILKARSIDDVSAMVQQLKNLLEGYPRYLPTFDELTVRNLQALRAGTAPLYQLLGWAALMSTASVTFLVTYLAAGRRGWEGGLLVSQGWSWRQLTQFFLGYYVILAGIAYGLSTLLSFLFTANLVFRYAVWGSEIVVSVAPQADYLFSALPLALLISAAASLTMAWRLKRIGLDQILREY